MSLFCSLAVARLIVVLTPCWAATNAPKRRKTASACSRRSSAFKSSADAPGELLLLRSSVLAWSSPIRQCHCQCGSQKCTRISRKIREDRKHMEVRCSENVSRPVLLLCWPSAHVLSVLVQCLVRYHAPDCWRAVTRYRAVHLPPAHGFVLPYLFGACSQRLPRRAHFVRRPLHHERLRR